MKVLNTISALLMLSLPALSQTTPVAPVLSNGQVSVTVQDSSGGSHVVTFPVTATTTLSVGQGTDTYTGATPPPNPTVTSVKVTCSPNPVTTGATSQCNATVQGTGSYSPAVTWSGASTNGLFTAPSSAGSATVSAASVQDPTKSGTASITVLTPSASGDPVIPANAISVDLINPKSSWKNTKDAGTPGAATFSNNYPVTGIFTDDARAFSIAYTGAGGVRFSNSFAKDTVATHFVYDVVVQSPDWTHTANLELDINQVHSDGKTAILGTQCSSYSHSWEITLNNSSTGKWHWVPSNLPCDPTKWTPNEIHHIRIFGTIDPSGISTYVGVELDGVYSAFTNASGMTARALGWSIGSILPNFQIDGKGNSGSAVIYSDKLTIVRW